jgi:hypothetical protein
MVLPNLYYSVGLVLSNLYYSVKCFVGYYPIFTILWDWYCSIEMEMLCSNNVHHSLLFEPFCLFYGSGKSVLFFRIIFKTERSKIIKVIRYIVQNTWHNSKDWAIPIPQNSKDWAIPIPQNSKDWLVLPNLYYSVKGFVGYCPIFTILWDWYYPIFTILSRVL